MKRVRELRNKMGISMKQLGSIIDVSESTISLYETGKREPDHETLKKLADFFNVSVDYLLDRDLDKEKSPLDKELEGVDFALYGEARDLTEEEKQDIIDFIKFKKSQRK
jgi:transcriptional regulator with XRE-family HTH domain